MKVSPRTVAVSELEPDPGNARTHDLEAIKASLEHHGQYRPLVVQSSRMRILAGNGTWGAARELGWERIRCELLDVSDDQARRIVLVDNRTNDLAGYDDELLAELLRPLDDLAGTGFDQDAITRLIDGQAGEAPPEADDAPDVPARPATRAGDVYELGDHRLLCGDATERASYERLLDGALAACVFTDPPYGVDYDGGAKRREKLAGDERGTSIYSEFLPLAVAHTETRAAFYIWYADLSIAAAAAAAGLTVRCQIIWAKNHAMFVSAAHYHGQHESCIYAGRTGKSIRWFGPKNEVTLWEIDRAPRNDFHPTQKPVALAERALANSSGGGTSCLTASPGRDRR